MRNIIITKTIEIAETAQADRRTDKPIKWKKYDKTQPGNDETTNEYDR